MAKAKSKREIKYKWRFAIGTTSRVPGSDWLHYAIFDFDGNDAEAKTIELVRQCKGSQVKYSVQQTQNGFHVYTDVTMSFPNIIRLCRKFGADPCWIRIGRKRGYLFLADKNEVQMSWPVERMALRWDENAEKKARRRI